MKTEKKDTFSRFGVDFQRDLCFLILEDRTFADQMEEVLDINFIEFKYLQLFVKKIIDYRRKYEQHPTTDVFKTVLRSDIEKESVLIQKQVREYFAHYCSRETIDGEEFTKSTALDFCKKQKLRDAMLKSVDLMEQSSFDEISKVINDALLLGSDSDYGYDYKKDFEERFLLKARNAVSTGWDKIDSIIWGGLGRGELGVVIAPTGAGKSMALVHLGAAALKEGLNVIHYTLELGDTVIAKRYDSCITGILLDDIVNLKDRVHEAVKNVKGELIVKEYPTKSASTRTILNHLERMKRTGFKIDMVIVDYGDLLRPVTALKEKRTELESIYEELRGISQSFECVVWTASQTNRTGLNQQVITMEAISEAFNKCFVADFIFSISRTKEDKQNNQGRMFIAKNRNGPDGLVYDVFMDPANVNIKVLSENIGAQVSNPSGLPSTEIMRNQSESLKEKYKVYRRA